MLWSALPVSSCLGTSCGPERCKVFKESWFDESRLKRPVPCWDTCWLIQGSRIFFVRHAGTDKRPFWACWCWANWQTAVLYSSSTHFWYFYYELRGWAGKRYFSNGNAVSRWWNHRGIFSCCLMLHTVFIIFFHLLLYCTKKLLRNDWTLQLFHSPKGKAKSSNCE